MERTDFWLRTLAAVVLPQVVAILTYQSIRSSAWANPSLDQGGIGSALGALVVVAVAAVIAALSLLTTSVVTGVVLGVKGRIGSAVGLSCAVATTAMFVVLAAWFFGVTRQLAPMSSVAIAVVTNALLLWLLRNHDAFDNAPAMHQFEPFDLPAHRAEIGPRASVSPEQPTHNEDL